ncbi:unannotated protein [freshwater metagenome]|uniref:Unannotated protein n=1 Tax=freshwater metagenome TaxID=449393 RepID=A0A6J6H805_9ZZZZ
MLGSDQLVEEGRRRTRQIVVDGQDSVAGDAQPVVLADGAAVTGRIAHRTGDLAGDDLRRSARHCIEIGLGGGSGVVREKRGEPLGDASGGNDADRLGRHRIDLLGDGDDVLVVRQEDDLRCRSGFHRLEELCRRRVHRLTPGDDDLDSEGVEDPPHAVTHGDSHNRTRNRIMGHRWFCRERNRFAHPALLLEFVEKIRHADALRPSDLDGGFDRRTDVVGVDVAVPETVPADNNDRIAERRPHILETGNRFVGGVQEVHDFVAEAGERGIRTAAVGCIEGLEEVGRDSRNFFVGFGHRTTVDDMQQRVEEQHEPGATRIDDAGIGEDLQHLRGVRKSVITTGVGCFENAEEIGACVGRHATGLGRNSHHGQDRAFDRTHDGAIGRRRCSIERSGERSGVDRTGFPEHAGEASEDLGEDDPRIAPGTHQRSVGDSRTRRIEVRSCIGELGHDRGEGERHVRAGVPIGYRVDIEPVDGLAVSRQSIGIAPDCLPEVIGGEAIERSHRPRHYLSGPARTPSWAEQDPAATIRLRFIRRLRGVWSWQLCATCAESTRLSVWRSATPTDGPSAVGIPTSSVSAPSSMVRPSASTSAPPASRQARSSRLSAERDYRLSACVASRGREVLRPDNR